MPKHPINSLIGYKWQYMSKKNVFLFLEKIKYSPFNVI